MEPLNEDELKDLLRRWDAPSAPDTVERRIFGEPVSQPWYRWLLSGSIRLPVPVVALLLLLLVSGWAVVNSRRDGKPAAQELQFSDFEPVKELKPRVLRSNYESH
jgi:hypothetical protein